MKKPIPIALCIALAGCAQAQRAADWLASEQAQKTAANLRNLAVAFDCGLIVSGAALSREIARAVDAGEAAVDRTGRIYAVSAAMCSALGGTPGAGADPAR